MTGQLRDRYVPEPTVDAWRARHQVAMFYPDGQEIKVGDWVDFGMKSEEIGIDPAEPWAGRVLAMDPTMTGVVVDTYCNAHMAFPPSKLNLIERDPRPTQARP